MSSPEPTIRPENVYTLLTSGEVAAAQVRTWADGHLLGMQVENARAAYRALAMTELPQLSGLSDQDRQSIGMTKLECEALLERGALERALSIQTLLDIYCKRAKCIFSTLDPKAFRACGDVCLRQGHPEEALYAYEIAQDSRGLQNVADPFFQKLETMLQEEKPDWSTVRRITGLLQRANLAARGVLERTMLEYHGALQGNCSLTQQ